MILLKRAAPCPEGPPTPRRPAGVPGPGGGPAEPGFRGGAGRALRQAAEVSVAHRMLPGPSSARPASPRRRGGRPGWQRAAAAAPGEGRQRSTATASGCLAPAAGPGGGGLRGPGLP